MLTPSPLLPASWGPGPGGPPPHGWPTTLRPVLSTPLAFGQHRELADMIVAARRRTSRSSTGGPIAAVALTDGQLTGELLAALQQQPVARAQDCATGPAERPPGLRR